MSYKSWIFNSTIVRTSNLAVENGFQQTVFPYCRLAYLTVLVIWHRQHTEENKQTSNKYCQCLFGGCTLQCSWYLWLCSSDGSIVDVWWIAIVIGRKFSCPYTILFQHIPMEKLKKTMWNTIAHVPTKVWPQHLLSTSDECCQYPTLLHSKCW